MSIPIINPTDGATLAAGRMTIRILEDGGLTGHRLGIVEITVPPKLAGPPQHVHREHDETFYVLAGTPSFTCGTDTVTATPGTLVVAAPGTPHTFANPGDVPAVILCTITPDLYIDYFRELDRLPAGPQGLDPAAVGAIMARYATEVVRPAP
jgi:mannose-6-phosphate isomerase-like protein (cupin superfamily)